MDTLRNGPYYKKLMCIHLYRKSLRSSHNKKTSTYTKTENFKSVKLMLSTTDSLATVCK